MPSDPRGQGGGRDRGSEGAPNPPYANPTLRRRRTGDTGPPSPGTALGVPGAAPGLAPDVEAVTALVDTVPPQRFARARTLPSRFRPATRCAGTELRANSRDSPTVYPGVAGFAPIAAARTGSRSTALPRRLAVRCAAGRSSTSSGAPSRVYRTAAVSTGAGGGGVSFKDCDGASSVGAGPARPSPLELARSFVAEPDVFRGCEGSASFVVLSVEPPEAPAPTPESALGPAASRAPARAAPAISSGFFFRAGPPGFLSASSPPRRPRLSRNASASGFRRARRVARASSISSRDISPNLRAVSESIPAAGSATAPRPTARRDAAGPAASSFRGSGFGGGFAPLGGIIWNETSAFPTRTVPGGATSGFRTPGSPAAARARRASRSAMNLDLRAANGPSARCVARGKDTPGPRSSGGFGAVSPTRRSTTSVTTSRSSVGSGGAVSWSPGPGSRGPAVAAPVSISVGSAETIPAASSAVGGRGGAPPTLCTRAAGLARLSSDARNAR